MKPIIGITTYGRDERKIKTLYYDEFFYLPTLYVDAVRRAGGAPVLLPPGGSDWDEWLALIDGLLVAGGGDMHPAEYRGRPEHKSIAGVDKDRDANEIALLQKVTGSLPMPTLCICRGMQVLNVALGGTLHEHIPDIRDEDIHRAADGGWTIQTIQVAAGSQLAEIMGATEVATHSGHHQAVKDLGQELVVVASAADGIPEALELPGHPWLVAVQWHPEMLAASEPSQQRIFDGLVKAARGPRSAAG
ncbi:MAG: gamma-glutamyl-gamma-aminobutyrate hydrolase family protein [Chloroflexota bacterium]|nr:MAG: gamma-glutamyl-gamma-aminobutyrate hydrolase family protein [Chloroflexota bacterium]